MHQDSILGASINLSQGEKLGTDLMVDDVSTMDSFSDNEAMLFKAWLLKKELSILLIMRSL